MCTQLYFVKMPGVSIILKKWIFLHLKSKIANQISHFLWFIKGPPFENIIKSKIFREFDKKKLFFQPGNSLNNEK